MRLSHVLGVLRDRHAVEEHGGPARRHQRPDGELLPRLPRPLVGDVEVARIAQRHAQRASSQIVDRAGRENPGDMRPRRGQHLAGGVVVLGAGAEAVLAGVEHRHRHHLAGRVQHVDAAVLQTAGVLGLEDQVQRVVGQRRAAQHLAHLLLIDAHGDEAPHPVHQVAVAGVGLGQLLQDGRVQVLPVGQQVAVQRLQQAALDLLGGEVRTGHHDVVAGLARHQAGVQGLVALDGGVVAHLDAGFLLEILDHAGADVVGPVVDVQHPLGWRLLRQCRQCGGQQAGAGQDGSDGTPAAHRAVGGQYGGCGGHGWWLPKRWLAPPH